MIDAATVRATTPRRPQWPWFFAHGGIILAWAVFALVAPPPGATGWLVNGVGFGVAISIAGVLLVVQAARWRRDGDGWRVLLASGVNPIGFGVVMVVLGSLVRPAALFWMLIAFLLVEGVLFWVGFAATPSLRLWGTLMGSLIFLGAAALFVVHLALDDPIYELVGITAGICGAMYGIAVMVAAVMVRGTALNQPLA